MAVFLKWLAGKLRGLPFIPVGGEMLPGVVTVSACERGRPNRAQRRTT